MILSLQNIRSTSRVILVGIVAGVVWYSGMVLVFGPAQQLLANPEFQSRKFLDVFTTIKPLPRMSVEPLAFYTGFLLVGIAFSLAYHLVARWLPGTIAKKGLLFGFVAWLLMNPWFEFYLPWNVMHEPLPLVLLEMILWLVVLMSVSFATVISYHFLETRRM